MKKAIIALIFILLVACSQPASNQVKSEKKYLKDFFAIANNLTIKSDDPIGSLYKQMDLVSVLGREAYDDGHMPILDMTTAYEDFLTNMIMYTNTKDEKYMEEATKYYEESLGIYRALSKE